MIKNSVENLPNYLEVLSIGSNNCLLNCIAEVYWDGILRSTAVDGDKLFFSNKHQFQAEINEYSPQFWLWYTFDIRQTTLKLTDLV